MKKYIVRVRRDEQRIERIERIRVGAKDLSRIARNTRNLLLRETPTDGTDWYRWLGCAEMNNGLNGLNGLNGFERFVLDRLRLNMCCCVLRRQDTSATDGCSENPINQINPL